jgi:Tol biopolymer transport system component
MNTKGWLLGCAGVSGVLALSAHAAPVLQGPPPRPLTDPASIVSPVNPDAQPAPVADLYFVRGLSDAAWSPDGKWIVISTNLTGRYNLWRLPAEGGFPEQLTVNDDRQSGIAITPGGQVLFQSDLAGAEIYDLWATPLSGGASVNITTTPEVSETGAIVSPDGGLIALDRRPKAQPSTEVAVMDLKTRQIRLLTHEAAADRTWSAIGFAEGGRVLIANRSDFNDTASAVWRIEVASGQARALTPASGENIQASAVSPDGRAVAVKFYTPAGVRQAGLLDTATGKITPLKPDGWEQDVDHFSPDGRVLIFASNVDGRMTLYAYDLARGTSRALPLPPGVSGPASDSGESFSPDGSRLLVSHQAGNASPDLWVVDLRVLDRGPSDAPGPRLAVASRPAGQPDRALQERRRHRDQRPHADAVQPGARWQGGGGGVAARRAYRPDGGQLQSLRHRPGLARVCGAGAQSARLDRLQQGVRGR